ncbi:MAG: MGMT family protein [Candidatus Saccharimonadales bacterium]|jgi:methylated-DNA-protein-cysteine methyltransferase-like protein
MPRVDNEFKNKVYKVVSQIPQGRVMTYGQIAALCGAAWAAWEVGQIAHFGPEYLPWQRVVNKKGYLANGFPGGKEHHKILLETEGIVVNEEYQVNIKELIWQP